MAPTVGVITMHRVKNYGSVLQTYATQVVLRNLDTNPYIIDFWRHDQRDGLTDIIAHTRWGRNRVTRAIYKSVRGAAHVRRREVFNTFVDDHLELSDESYHSLEEIIENPPKADIYCTGSDQTWNRDYNGASHAAYFLPWVTQERRKFSFSASLGRATVSPDEEDELRIRLGGYHSISVRESEGVELLDRIGIASTHLLDPTLLLTKEEWAVLAEDRLPLDGYVLEYELNANPLVREVSREIARRHGWKVIRLETFPALRPSTTKSVTTPTVPEWLSLILHANAVVTDSFHGTAFTLNFNRPLYVVPPPKYAGRLHSILELTGMGSRIVQDGAPMEALEMDFAHVNASLAAERQKATAFLRAAVNT